MLLSRKQPRDLPNLSPTNMCIKRNVTVNNISTTFNQTKVTLPSLGQEWGKVLGYNWSFWSKHVVLRINCLQYDVRALFIAEIGSFPVILQTDDKPKILIWETLLFAELYRFLSEALLALLSLCRYESLLLNRSSLGWISFKTMFLVIRTVARTLHD